MNLPAAAGSSLVGCDRRNVDAICSALARVVWVAARGAALPGSASRARRVASPAVRRLGGKLGGDVGPHPGKGGRAGQIVAHRPAPPLSASRPRASLVVTAHHNPPLLPAAHPADDSPRRNLPPPPPESPWAISPSDPAQPVTLHPSTPPPLHPSTPPSEPRHSQIHRTYATCGIRPAPAATAGSSVQARCAGAGTSTGAAGRGRISTSARATAWRATTPRRGPSPPRSRRGGRGPRSAAPWRWPTASFGTGWRASTRPAVR